MPKLNSQQSETIPQELIQKLAYELYEKKGRKDGNDVEDWLLAEKIIKSQNIFKS